MTGKLEAIPFPDVGSGFSRDLFGVSQLKPLLQLTLRPLFNLPILAAHNAIAPLFLGQIQGMISGMQKSFE